MASAPPPEAASRASLADRLRAWPYWPVVAFVLGLKVLLLLHGGLSFLTPWDDSITSARALFETWNRWDSLNYLHIAEFGYESTGDMRHLLVFYPLYPALIRLLEPLCGSFLAAGFWISTLASLAAAVLFHRLASQDQPGDASRAVFFLFVFPTSFALHIAYTESLFLMLSFGSLLLARSRRWALAGLLGAAAALTRINGLALGAALLVEVWAARREEGRFRSEWLFVLLTGVGAVGFLLVNYAVTGDALAFLRHQHDHFKRTLAFPWTGYFELWRAVLIPAPSEAFVQRTQELLFGTLMIAGCVAGVRRLRPSYTAWMVTNTVLALSFTYPWSVPRYALVLFPLFLLMARLGRRPVPFALMAAWSLLTLALYSSLFVRGFWAY
jgi:hypothetical protein